LIEFGEFCEIVREFCNFGVNVETKGPLLFDGFLDDAGLEWEHTCDGLRRIAKTP
jgi:hypothetical protein